MPGTYLEYLAIKINKAPAANAASALFLKAGLSLA
jgi:hypothetical protein